jgi:hypothetical protein
MILVLNDVSSQIATPSTLKEHLIIGNPNLCCDRAVLRRNYPMAAVNGWVNANTQFAPEP